METFNLGRIIGYSAYELAVQEGYTGTEAEWLASLQGPTGPVGPQGPKGDKGDPGTGGASAWTDITNKPFSSIGSGLSVSNDVLSADGGQDGFSPIVTVQRNQADTGVIISIQDKTGVKTATVMDGEDGASSWADISNKPFTTIGSGLTVTNNVLSVTGGGGSQTENSFIIENITDISLWTDAQKVAIADLANGWNNQANDLTNKPQTFYLINRNSSVTTGAGTSGLCYRPIGWVTRSADGAPVNGFCIYNDLKAYLLILRCGNITVDEAAAYGVYEVYNYGNWHPGDAFTS